jgi:hypothetical protein
MSKEIVMEKIAKKQGSPEPKIPFHPDPRHRGKAIHFFWADCHYQRVARLDAEPKIKGSSSLDSQHNRLDSTPRDAKAARTFPDVPIAR